MPRSTGSAATACHGRKGHSDGARQKDAAGTLVVFGRSAKRSGKDLERGQKNPSLEYLAPRGETNRRYTLASLSLQRSIPLE